MLKKALEIDPEKAAVLIKDFIATKVGEAGASGVALGMSGGLDSSLTGLLCVEALGSEKVSALVMPERESGKEDTEDAISFAKEIGIACGVIDFSPILDAYKGAFEAGDMLSLGNLKARIRMSLLYYHANEENRLVVGTSNRSEIMVGYFTKYGDGAADIAPLGALYKTQVRRLAEYLNLPEHIIEKEPSGGLWPGQTDEGELGLSYNVLDLVLCGLDIGMEEEVIAAELEIAFDVVKRVAAFIEGSRHKRSLPEIPDLG